MSFLTSTAYTVFSPNTKAKSAEVNANNAVTAAFFNTITSDILIGSAWQNIASTAASHTLTAADSIRTFLVNVNTSAGYTVTLPTAAASTHRFLSVKNIGATTGALTIDAAGAELIDDATTIPLRPKDAATLHCDGSVWRVIGKHNAVTPAFRVDRNGTGLNFNSGDSPLKVTSLSEASALAFDQGSNFASDKFTVPAGADGIYHIGFHATFSGAELAADSASARIYKNGSLAAIGTRLVTTAGDQMVSVAVDLSLAAADYIEFYVATSAGVNIALEGTAAYTYAYGHKIS